MMTQSNATTKSRKISGRLVVEADLVLQTPAHLGSGDGDDLVDMPLLVDAYDGKTPLLTGASIAGALRSYLREREGGYRVKAQENSLSFTLFGWAKADDEGKQSAIIVDDSLGENSGVEMRHGVRIDPKSRTAEEKKLFDLHLWQAGTKFPLRVELLLNTETEDDLMRALFTALAGLDDGSITIGARKRRGYGQVKTGNWRVRKYDLLTEEGILAWLEDGSKMLTSEFSVASFKEAIGSSTLVEDTREYFKISAVFRINGSLLIRSGVGNDDQGPDMVYLHTRDIEGKTVPVLPGTSLAGVIRARAWKIANLLLGNEAKTKELIDDMFGGDVVPETEPMASRVLVQEKTIKNGRCDLVQNRVSIDRFTGGARDTALFNEQPVFADEGTTVSMELMLINPKDCEIGLLLFVLKDLWTQDLPVGGESSVGRGRLAGVKAKLTSRKDGAETEWTIETIGDGLKTIKNITELEDYANALVEGRS